MLKMLALSVRFPPPIAACGYSAVVVRKRMDDEGAEKVASPLFLFAQNYPLNRDRFRSSPNLVKRSTTASKFLTVPRMSTFFGM